MGIAVAACAPPIPTFAPLPGDAGAACGPTRPCLTGQRCLSGRCYDECGPDRRCGPRESCMNGLCVLDVPDAGGRDAGPPDPCELAGCGVGGELARPRCRAGICMACESPLDCVTSSAPVCDIALGACVARPTPARCEPCTFAEDCGASLVCVDRDAPLERVCLERCEDGETCPSGFECLGALCYPTIGASCTGMREARAGRTCTTDADCAPVAATYDSGLFQGSCFEEPAGSGSRCHHPCGLPSDCPAGLRCDPVREFCVSP